MSKNIISVLIIILVLIGGAVFYWNRVPMTENLPEAKISNNEVSNPSSTLESVVKETVFQKKPGSELTRHSFEGDVKEITADGQSSKIVLLNESNLTLPDFIVKSTTRVWKKTGVKFEPTQIGDVKIGSHIDLHLDKDDKQGFWILRDIYILK